MEFHHQDWNQGAEQIFGYKPKEIIGKSVLTLIPKDRQSEEEEILRKVRRVVNHWITTKRFVAGRMESCSTLLLTISPIKGPERGNSRRFESCT